MNKQDLSKLQTCVLRVNIHCDGCKKKVKKLLQKIEGVYSTKIDAETGKVTVTGNVDTTTLVKKLIKSGKHAEIWSFQKGSINFQGNLNNQFKNMVQIENPKVGQNNHHHHNHKAHNNGGKDQQQQKLGHSYKDPMAMAMAAPPKDKKYVKNNLPEEEFDVSDDEFVDKDEFNDDDYDDEFDGDDDGGDDGGDDGDHGFNHGNHGANKMMAIPMMGKGHGPHVPNGMVNVHAINKGGVGSNQKGGVGSNQKGGVIDIPIVLKGKSEKTDPQKGNNGGKKGCSGEKSGGGEGFGGGKTKGSEEKKGGKSKKDGKGGGGLLGYGKKSGGLFGFGKKKSCKGEKSEDSKKGKAKGSTNNNGSIKGGGKHESGPKKGGGRKDDLHEFSPLEDGFHEINVSKPVKGGKGGGNGCGGGGGPSVNSGLKMGPMGPVGPRGLVNGHPNQFGPMSHVNGLPGQMFPGQMGPIAHGNGHMGQMGSNLGQMGNYPMGHMGNIPAVQGLPAQAMMNGGYYQGVGPANPYNQQYITAMMMNQQRAMGNGMHQPMMFGGPFPMMNHGSMPPISPARDSYVHYFSDENANSCSIM